MNSLNAEQLRRNLRGVVEDVEQALQSMTGATGEQAEELRWQAGRRLRQARDRLGEMEHRAADGMRAAGHYTQRYARQHPWLVLGGVAAVAVLLVALSGAKRRH